MSNMQNPKQTVKGVASLIVLVVLCIWIYNYFFVVDNRPVAISYADDNVLRDDDVSKAIDASNNNEPKFNSYYKDKPIITIGLFKEANKDLFHYNIAVDTEYGPVVCQSSNNDIIAHVSFLESRQPVVIYGIIDSTWMGQLELSRCGVDYQKGSGSR